MLSWIAVNIGTIFICVVLALIVACIVGVIVRDRKKGKSSCGGSCGHCPMGGSCHSHSH